MPHDQPQPFRKRVLLRVRGQVQGVSYRAYTQAEARSLGLTGWVRNLPNGDVEVLAEGTQEALVRLVDFCHRGPPMAEVEEVQVSWAEASGEGMDFSIRR